MPVTRRGKRPPQGVKHAAMVLSAAGIPTRQIARELSLEQKTVRKLRHRLEAIYPEEDVKAIKAYLSPAQTVAAAYGATRALQAAKKNDPKAYTAWSFGSKINTEAARVSAPNATQPGFQVLALIGQLNTFKVAGPDSLDAELSELGSTAPASSAVETGTSGAFEGVPAAIDGELVPLDTPLAGLGALKQ